MHEAQKNTVQQALEALLAGETLSETEKAVCREVYGWRLLRLELALPVPPEQLDKLRVLAADAMRPLGKIACRERGGALEILAACIAFPARTHRDTVLWLCVQAIMEKSSVLLDQESTLFISEEANFPEVLADPDVVLTESTEWWSLTNPISPPVARLHRTHLQIILKRRQYTSIAGYVSRALHNEQEMSKICFAFVPLMIEAVWSQHAEIPLEELTKDLSLQEMMRKPREALLSWIECLPDILRACPTAVPQPPIERVVASIEADCSLPYSQDNLSRSLGLSPAYFCRLFYEKTGQHFSTFLTLKRMKKARDLLTPPVKGTLQEISQACGYPNKSYFCQVFKNYTGMTPGEFELQQQK